VIAKLYSKTINQKIDPLKQVLITIGAYGSLHNAITSLLNKDDEVKKIIFNCVHFMIV